MRGGAALIIASAAAVGVGTLAWLMGRDFLSDFDEALTWGDWPTLHPELVGLPAAANSAGREQGDDRQGTYGIHSEDRS